MMTWFIVRHRFVTITRIVVKLLMQFIHMELGDLMDERAVNSGPEKRGQFRIDDQGRTGEDSKIGLLLA